MRVIFIVLMFISSAFGVTFVAGPPVKDDNHFSYTATTAQDLAIAMKIAEQKGYSLRIDLTEATPAAFNIYSASSNIFTHDNTFYKEDHGLVTGASVNITTSDTLPTGLEEQAGFFISRIDDDFFYVMSSRALAIAGTPALVITNSGTGTQTFTPAGSYRGDVAVQYSLNNSDWVDIVHYNDIGTTYLEDDNFNANWIRIAVQATQGQVLIKADLNAK